MDLLSEGEKRGNPRMRRVGFPAKTNFSGGLNPQSLRLSPCPMAHFEDFCFDYHGNPDGQHWDDHSLCFQTRWVPNLNTS